MLLSFRMSCMFAVVASRPALKALTAGPAVVRVRDYKTDCNVVLVGSMHYNPHSCDVARAVINEEASKGELRAVGIESCPSRWKQTQEFQPAGSIWRTICDNEMQTAADAAEDAGVEFLLLDATVEETALRIPQLIVSTLMDIFTPWTGGWRRVRDDIDAGLAQTDGGDGTTAAMLEPRLLLGAPFSFVRYPLSLIARNPLIGLLVAGVSIAPIFLFSRELSEAIAVGGYTAALPSDWATTEAISGCLALLCALGFAALELVVLSRVLLVAILEERNFVMARNIRKAGFAARPGGSVVAVMGLGHCAGVAKLIRDSRVV